MTNNRNIARFPFGKPKNNTQPSYKVSIIDFLKISKPELKATKDDSLNDIKLKDDQLNSLFNLLKDYAKMCFSELKMEISTNSEYKGKTWGKLPVELKTRYIVALENLAVKGGINLNQCQDRWAADRLMANIAHNQLGAKVLS